MVKCGVFDSEFTERGTKRKKVYIGSCGLGLTYEAKAQALKDFTEYKKTLGGPEKIKPFKRTLEVTNNSIGSRYESEREILLARQEWADVAFQYLKYIL